MATSPARHATGAVIEGLLIAAIIGALLLALSPMYKPARFAAGTGVAAAAGRQTYTLTYAGFRVWQEPYAYADFAVTRSKVDGTDVWVKARCVDATGAQAIAGADQYAYVKWDSADPLVGHAAMDSVKNGTTCDTWLTRSFKSTEAAPGWPELYLDVNW
jgi:hypothetical protein